MLELYHFEAVANSMKPMLYLKEKGLDFVSHRLNARDFEHLSAQFLAINPDGQVPVLVHDGKVVTESTVINEYLEDVFPEPPLRPADPLERARMRIWTKFVDEYFCPALTVIGSHGASKFVKQMDQNKLQDALARMPLKEVRDKWATISTTSYSEETLAEARRKLGVCAERMEKALATSPWLAGKTYSLADIDIYSFAVALPRIFPDSVNDQATPKLMDWIARMNERRAVKAALAMGGPMPPR